MQAARLYTTEPSSPSGTSPAAADAARRSIAADAKVPFVATTLQPITARDEAHRADGMTAGVRHPVRSALCRSTEKDVSSRCIVYGADRCFTALGLVGMQSACKMAAAAVSAGHSACICAAVAASQGTTPAHMPMIEVAQREVGGGRHACTPACDYNCTISVSCTGTCRGA